MEVLRRVTAEGTSLLRAKAYYKLAVAHFRQRFERLYPRFLPVLREKVATIGRKEELTYMLMRVLSKDTHQITTIMGIAYKSANMARYRLRQKLGLDTGESLDDFIKALAE